MGRWMDGGRAALGGLVTAVLAACGGSAETEHVRVEVSVLKAAVPAGFQGHGTWWNPAEPGTGFFFEAQGPVAVATFFVFDAGGRPTWVSAAGSFVPAGSGYRFEGTLQRYAGGQPATSINYAVPRSQPVGPVAITFDGDTAQVALPRRSFAARKYATAPLPASGLQPEAGIYWEPSQSGRGYAVETIGASLAVTMFHYDERGEPTWNLAVGALRHGAFTAPFDRYIGGQTLDGPFTGAPGLPAVQGTLGASFLDPCLAQIWLPGMPNLTIRRFAFGTLPAGAECRWSTGATARTAAEGPTYAARQGVLAATGQGVVQPGAVAVDAAGNVYVADEQDHTVRKITRDGAISVVLAGVSGQRGYANGRGEIARFAAPAGIAVDAQGVVYVSDRDNDAIRRIAPDGTVTTLAGQPGQPAVVDGALATARFAQPGKLKLDARGNLYVAEGAAVRRIGADGQVTTLLGRYSVAQRLLGDGNEAGFHSVQSVAVDAAGGLFVIERDSAGRTWIRKFDAGGRWLRLPNTADGTLAMPFATDLAVDEHGNLYVLASGVEDVHSLAFEGLYKVTPTTAMTLYGGAVLPTYPTPSSFPRRLGTGAGVALDPGVGGGGRAVVADRGGRVWQLQP